MDKMKEVEEYIRNCIKEKQKELLSIQGEIDGMFTALSKVINIQVTEQAEKRYTETQDSKAHLSR